MNNTLYATPKKSFENFRKGTCYIIHGMKTDYLDLEDNNKVRSWQLRKDFEITDCIFNEPKQTETFIVDGIATEDYLLKHFGQKYPDYDITLFDISYKPLEFKTEVKIQFNQKT